MGPHFLVFSALFPSEIDDHSFKSTFSKIKKSLLLLKECQFGQKMPVLLKLVTAFLTQTG